jgi:hypothetical protein
MRFVAIPFAMCVAALPVFAQQYMDASKFALTLGGVLGEESVCGLTYNVDRVEQYIGENADPADLAIASALSLMTDGTKFEFESMSATAKAAQCKLAERSARTLGFVQ